MKSVLFIAPTAREFKNLPVIAAKLDVNLIFDEFAGDYFDDFLLHDQTEENTLDIVALIEETIARHKGVKLDGVTTAIGYPGMPVIAVIAQRLGLPGPKPQTIIECDHKYYSRKAQQKLVPHATPPFALIDQQGGLVTDEALPEAPLFLKPAKSCTSMNSYKIRDLSQLQERAASALLPSRFLAPFDDLLSAYTDFPLSCKYLLAEQLLIGHQVSLEGFVFEGQPVVMGIVDGEMIDDTLSFKRWLYPSHLPQDVQQRMEEIALRFFSGMHYDNAMFNMELMWEPSRDRVSIIEVNPKIASQFVDLFEKVDGTNAYEILLQVATGQKPEFHKRRGRFATSASCVLRSHENKKVLRKPTPEEIKEIQTDFPDAVIHVLATEGRHLSEQSQDTSTFRYGLINIGANSQDELEKKKNAIQERLHYVFAEPDSDFQPGASSALAQKSSERLG